MNPECFFESVSYFSVGFGSGSCLGSYINFSNILNKLRYCILWRDISLLGTFFWIKRNLYFLIEYFCWEIVIFCQLFGVVLLQIHFGFGVARIRIRNNFSISVSCQRFRVRPDPDPQHCSEEQKASAVHLEWFARIRIPLFIKYWFPMRIWPRKW